MLRNLIVLPDGTEILSGSGTINAIQSATYTSCVNGGTELYAGSACSSALEAKIFTPNGELKLEAGTEITYCKVNDNGERIKVGLFTLEKPTRSSAHTYKIIAYDRVSWLDRDLTEWLKTLTEWPYRLDMFARMVCEACGLALVTESIPNGGYMVRQFEATVTGRKLMQWVGEACGRFCRANADGEIELSWYREVEKTIAPNGTYYAKAGSLSYEDYQTEAIGKVHLRSVENDVGVVWPNTAEELNTYVITGNYLLYGDSTENLMPVAETLYGELKDISYTPCKVVIPANMDICAGDIVKITDNNGVTITTYVMTKKQTGQMDTLECTGSTRRDSASAVNEESYSKLSGQVLSISKTVEGLEVKAQNLRQEVSNTYTKATQTAQEIVLSAVGEYIKTSDFETFKESIKTVLEINPEAISMTFESIKGDIEAAKENANSEFTEIKRYIRFEGGAIILGGAGNQIILTIKNDRISFEQNGQEVCYISNSKMYIPVADITDSAGIVGLNIYRAQNRSICIN